IPLAMINGRLSARSAARWSKMPKLISTILSWFDVVLAQSVDDASRLKSLGARAIPAGNIKYAAAPLAVDAQNLASLKTQINGRSIVLFASTHAGEEDIVRDVYKNLSEKHPNLLIAIMPRHPRRGDEIITLLSDLNVARRSTGDAITPSTQIYLADTVGEAGLFYTLAPIAFVGNSLITDPGGGHNLLEPAHLDCAILHGPHMWNFPEIERDLRAAGGSVTVKDTNDLTAQIDALLKDSARRQALADAALAFVRTQDKVLDDVTEHLRPVMGKAGIVL
ncbi:MAG TPA: glycosyltransferase N-terminal domain-containing protein, partial [Alphaproteobacteria bacterium]